MLDYPKPVLDVLFLSKIDVCIPNKKCLVYLTAYVLQTFTLHDAKNISVSSKEYNKACTAMSTAHNVQHELHPKAATLKADNCTLWRVFGVWCTKAWRLFFEYNRSSCHIHACDCMEWTRLLQVQYVGWIAWIMMIVHCILPTGQWRCFPAENLSPTLTRLNQGITMRWP